MSDTMAPRPEALLVDAERVRCVCTAENLLVYHRAWYPGQEDEESETRCVVCERPLAQVRHPRGSVVHGFTLQTVPAALLPLLDAALCEEIRQEGGPAQEPMPVSWTVEHPAPEAYLHQVEQPQPPPPPDRRIVVQNVVITLAIAILVAALAFG